MHELVEKFKKKSFFKGSYIYDNFSKKTELDSFYRRSVKNSPRAFLYIYVQSSRRSTRISVINPKGLTLLTLTVGMLFNKSQRKGPYPAVNLFKAFRKKYNKIRRGHRSIICLKGRGPGRRPVISFLSKGHFRKNCYAIVDLTRLTFNGCRVKKRRRL